MQKAHDASKNDFWRNKPDTSSPITQTELNRMETSMDVIDDRVVTFDTTKANQSDMLQAIKSIAFNSSTGIFTITFFNNVTATIDTDIEKIAINFDYDDDPESIHYQNLVIDLDDGTKKYVDLSALITIYEFADSSMIHFTVAQNGTISATLIDGSVTAAKLQPNFLADCVAAKTAAQTAATSASGSKEDSEAWAVGKRNGTDVGSTDPTYHNNSKYWADQAHSIVGDKVDSFNGRTGVVVPTNNDYSITQINPGSGAYKGQIPVVNSSGRFALGYPSESTTFSISTNKWVANSDSDATEFPYVCNITTALYSNTFQPAEVLLVGAVYSDYPTASELVEIDKVNMYVKFTGSAIRLRATQAPTTALTLIVTT